MADTQYTVTQSVPLATLVALLTGFGITIVPGSAFLVGDARAFGTLTTPWDLSINRMDIPAAAAAVLGNAIVVLSTGQVTTVRGPNSGGSTGTNLGKAGDAALAALCGVAVGTTHDAAILSFQFIPTGSRILLPYIFGSEEYNEFVYSTFEDLMGIWLAGPTDALPGTQLALVPVTANFISINKVHDGKPVGTPPVLNPNFYTNNDFHPTSPIFSQLDGFVGLNAAGTVPMLVAATVVPGQTYTLRIGICDVTDGNLDSAVFLGQLAVDAASVPGFYADLPVPAGNSGGSGCSADVTPAAGGGGGGCSATVPAGTV